MTTEEQQSITIDTLTKRLRSAIDSAQAHQRNCIQKEIQLIEAKRVIEGLGQRLSSKMRKKTIKGVINGKEEDIDVWIYEDADYDLPEFKKPKTMTNVFLMLLSLLITVLVGLYLYFQ